MPGQHAWSSTMPSSLLPSHFYRATPRGLGQHGFLFLYVLCCAVLCIIPPELPPLAVIVIVVDSGD